MRAVLAHLAHGSSGHHEEVRAALPISIVMINKPKIGLRNETRGADRSVLLATQFVLRATVQFFIYDRQELIERLPISSS